MSSAARILVVDDDVRERDALVHALQIRGYRTTPADPGEADHVARLFRPDLVVLEMVGADGVNGEDIAQGLRAHSDPLQVFVSREHHIAARLVAFEAGADDYVTKPYEIEELAARLRAVLRRSRRMGHAVSQVGRLVVDERSQVVEFAGHRLDLVPTDFALLAVLARHAGQVLTKARLLELVWGYESYDENLVTVRISLLRQHLGRVAGGLVHTVSGVGHVLRDEESATA